MILGSTTPPGRLHRAVEGAIERAGERGVEADLFDLGAHTIGFADGTPAADLSDDTATAIVMPVAVYLNGGDFEDGVPGERAATLLDQLFAATTETATALAGTAAGIEPSPLAAKAIKPRPAAAR